MCQKVKGCNRRIDKCIFPLIQWIRKCGYHTVASCCGHGRYPMTIVVKYKYRGEWFFKELITNAKIPRKRRYYRKDEDGHYYIPEAWKSL